MLCPLSETIHIGSHSPPTAIGLLYRKSLLSIELAVRPVREGAGDARPAAAARTAAGAAAVCAKHAGAAEAAAVSRSDGRCPDRLGLGALIHGFHSI